MLLVRYLGEYVEGLESNHLRISVMSGDVNLKNLRLKSNILDNLNLPVTVHAGSLCKSVREHGKNSTGHSENTTIMGRRARWKELMKMNRVSGGVDREDSVEQLTE